MMVTRQKSSVTRDNLQLLSCGTPSTRLNCAPKDIERTCAPWHGCGNIRAVVSWLWDARHKVRQKGLANASLARTFGSSTASTKSSRS